jgi:hypothetical protein
MVDNVTSGPLALPPAASPTYVPPVARPEDVHVSSDPAERLAQLDGFFRRNPGYAATAPVVDAMRGAAKQLPFGQGMVAALTPTELGYGQLIHDQMAWQQLTTRQPDNEWWMEMNSHLVGDPLQAEPLVRSGRAAEAPNTAVAAWARYVEKSDAVKAGLGLPADEAFVLSADGKLEPVAISDVSRRAPLKHRVEARLRLMEDARGALWDAHMATLEYHYPRAEEQLRSVARTRPAEAKFASAWANAVGYLSKFKPMATGRWALLGQQALLPDAQLGTDAAGQPWPKRAFAGVIGWLDRARFHRVVGDAAKAIEHVR